MILLCIYFLIIYNTVNGYTKYELDTLKGIVELRNFVYNSLSEDEKIKTNKKISSSMSNVLILSENYHELMDSEKFIELSWQLSKIEDEIANSKKNYNGTVRDVNNKEEMLLSNIISSILGYKTKSMYEISTGEKQNVSVGL